jgi:hypothetical protein
MALFPTEYRLHLGLFSFFFASWSFVFSEFILEFFTHWWSSPPSPPHTISSQEVAFLISELFIFSKTTFYTSSARFFLHCISELVLRFVLQINIFEFLPSRIIFIYFGFSPESFLFWVSSGFLDFWFWVYSFFSKFIFLRFFRKGCMALPFSVGVVVFSSNLYVSLFPQASYLFILFQSRVFSFLGFFWFSQRGFLIFGYTLSFWKNWELRKGQ